MPPPGKMSGDCEVSIEPRENSPATPGAAKKRPRSESPSLCDDQAEGEEGDWEEEDAQSSGSEPATDTTTDTPVITPFDWSNTTPAEPLTIEVRVPRRTCGAG